MVRDVINDSVISITNEEFLELCKSGDASKVKEAIMNGTNVNVKDNNGRTALFWASANGHTKIVELLLMKGADVNSKGNKVNNGATALIWAAYQGHAEVVELLLMKGANVNARDKDGTTALMCAARRGYIEITELLLNYGINVNAKNKYDMYI